MLTTYSFNRFSHGTEENFTGMPNLRLLEHEVIRPGDYAPVLVEDYGQVRLRHFQWGLIPYWASDEEMGQNRTLAPAHNIFERPSFEIPIRKQRCLIPADSFSVLPDALKGSSAELFARKDRQNFCFAGIFESWRQPDGSLRKTFALVGVPAPQIMANSQPTPLILSPRQYKTWLNPDTSLTQIANLMRSTPWNLLQEVHEPAESIAA
ncbi:MAG: SOS response-associated peptidase family protein [Bacteroidota bacterium]